MNTVFVASHLSLYNKIITSLREIMVTQCANISLDALIAGSAKAAAK
jgi:hypothetical protein